MADHIHRRSKKFCFEGKENRGIDQGAEMKTPKAWGLGRGTGVVLVYLELERAHLIATNFIFLSDIFAAQI